MSADTGLLATERLRTLQSPVLLLFLVIAFGVCAPHFLSVSNLVNVLSASATIGLLALGGTFVIAGGGIDLSSASVMALSSVVSALFIRHLAAPAPLAALCAVLTGGLCGSLSGLLINASRAPSFLVTLGMLGMARALAFILARGIPIYGLPAAITQIGQSTAGPLLFLACGALAAWCLLNRTKFGRHVLLTGDNPLAARAMGLPLSVLRLKIFALAGAFSGLAGFVFLARTDAGDPAAGEATN